MLQLFIESVFAWKNYSFRFPFEIKLLKFAKISKKVTKKLIIFTDGGARGNPGSAAVGVMVKDETGQKLATISRTIGETTNNVAEYQAVVAALEWIRENKQILKFSNSQIAQFYLDSKLVVNQLNGLFKIKENHLKELLLKVKGLEQDVGGNIFYNLIPREKNWEADALVNKALDENG